MPRFISNSGSFSDLIVTGSRLYVVSSSVFFNNLTPSPTAPNVLLLDNNGQIFYTASSALSAMPQTFNTSSLLTTASVSSNIITFTKGNGDTFPITISTGSAVTVNTGSLLTTASVSSNIITFTKGDTSQFSLTVNTGSAVNVSTASLLTTASVSSNIITFTKGNGDTFPITVNTGSGGSSAPTSFIATGSVTASVNIGTGDIFTVTSASLTEFAVRGTGVRIGNVITDIHTVTGSLNISGSLNATSSWAINALTSSKVIGGTANYIARWTDTTTLSIGSIQDDNATVTIGVRTIIGNANTATGANSLAQGNSVSATGQNSHAQGVFNIASGDNSHAEGYQTTASGDYSHAEGFQTFATGSNSHAEGDSTIAIGQGSHAEGKGTIASGSYQLAIGQYNRRGNTTSLFVIGNGTGDLDNNRSDVVRVETSGVQITGSLTVSSGSTEFQVLGTGVKMGNAIGDAHTVTGSLSTSGSLNVNNTLYVSGSNVGIGISTPTGSLHVNPPFISETSNNAYRVGNLIANNGYSAGGINQTYDVFSVGLNPTSSGNGTSFFRVNLNGGNSPIGVGYGSSGNNNALIQLNSTTKSSLYLTAQNSGLLIYGGINLTSTITTVANGQNLNIRSDADGATSSGGGINYYSSINGDAHSHRWYNNTIEQMRLTFNGNLQVGYTGSLHPTESFYRFAVTGSGTSGSLNINNTLLISGSSSRNTIIQNSGTDTLKVIGSGSIAPILTVQGSLGELFNITDSLTGSLFSVNDMSGLPILDVNSDQTVKMGSFPTPGMYTSTRVNANSGITVIYSLPTSSYDAVWYDYTIKSGSVGRVGQIMAMWSGSSVNFTEVSASSFGTTTGFVFGVNISGSNMILSGSATTSGWTIKTIIRSI